MSFKMAYNLVSEWARPQKGVGGKNSYCLGISDELSRMAKREKAAEEAEAKRAERGGITAKNREEGTEIQDRKSTRLNSSHSDSSRMPSSA